MSFTRTVNGTLSFKSHYYYEVPLYLDETNNIGFNELNKLTDEL